MGESEKKVILLIEDERVTAKTVVSILEKNGYSVIHALSGEEAISAAENCSKLDLLLSDIDLGDGMDGPAAAEEILKYKKIPALFLSSHTEREVVEKAEKITSYGYVVKNTGETVLIASMKMAFRLFEAHEIINTQNQELEASYEEMQASMEELEEINDDLITTQKQLIESEAKYRRLHESITEAVLIVDLTGKIIETNKAYQMMTGYSEQELLNMKYTDLTPPGWEEKEQKVLQEQLLKNGYSDFYEKEYIRKDGAIFPVELKTFLLKDNNNNYNMAWAIVRDITERKKTFKAIEERELKFRTIFENAPYSIVINRLSDGVYIDVNRKFREYAGLEIEEIYGKKTEDLVRHVDPSDAERLIQEFYNNGIIENFQYQAYNNEGNIIHNMISVFPITLNDEKCTISIVVDITKLKEAELKALMNEKLNAEANNILQLVLNTIPSRIFWKGTDLKYLGCNRLVAMDAGVSSPEDLIGLDDYDTPWKDHAEKYRADDQSIISTGIPKINYEEKLTQSDGKILWLNTSKVPLCDIEGKIIGILGTWEDITENKNAKESLSISEERFRSIIQSSSDMIFIVDKNNLIIYESPSVAGILGYPENYFLGKSPFTLIYPVDLDNVLIEMDKVSRSINDGLPTEFRLIKSDKTLIYLEAIASNLMDNPAVNGIVITARDISERKKAEEAVRLSEGKFRNIFETMTIGYYRTTLNGNFLDINPACLRIFGYDSIEDAKQILGDNSRKVYADPEEWIRIRKNFSDGAAPETYTVRLLKKDGTKFFGNISLRQVNSSDGTPLHIEGLIEDITERLKTQELLIQSEKMITIAGLAAGMAHEINNPLGIIMQNAENARNRLYENIPGNLKAAEEAGASIEAIRKYVSSRRIDNYLNEIHEAGTRAAKIVGNMLQFSRRTESKFSYLNINNIIDKAIDLAMNDYDLKKKYDFRKMQIIKHYGILPEIQCEETQIEQVFLNIFKNAAQSMTNKTFTGEEGPALTIITDSVNGSSRIEISDNGPGMPETVRKKIFEPFFTTKDPGSGTGLGLSVSFYIIVSGHGGTITAESILGTGTTLIITLPERNRTF